MEMEMEMKAIPSKNSTTATNGIRAENVLCSQEDIKICLEAYFGLPIKSLTRITGKKFDIKVVFENGTETTIQNKDGNVGGRGFSVDRRKVENYNDEQLMILLNTLCLKQGTEKPVISDNISKNVINMCILGHIEEDSPKYFTHTTSNKQTGKIISLSICTIETLMTFMYDALYKDMLPKRTCLHLSPNCYLQRKGGKDTRPNDIQMKFIFTQQIEKLFTPLYKP